MAHFILLALGAFMSSLRVKDRTKSWEAHQRNQQFGENESIDIGKSHWLQIEGNCTINKVSAMRPGLAKIIENVHISSNFERPETVIPIAANACWIEYTDTWSSKQIHCLSKSQCTHHCTTHYRCQNTVEFSTGVSWAGLLNTRIHWRVVQESLNSIITNLSSLHKINAPLSSTSWKFYIHSDTGPCG